MHILEFNLFVSAFKFYLLWFLFTSSGILSKLNVLQGRMTLLAELV